MQVVKKHIGDFLENLKITVSAVKLAFIVTQEGFTDEMLSKMKVQLSLNTKNGNVALMPLTPLRLLLNISSFAEGAYQISPNGLRGVIDLSHHCALDMSNGEELELKYEGFPKDCTTDIFAIDTPIHCRQAFVLERFSIENAEKTLNVASKVGLYLPIQGDTFTELTVQYSERSVSFTKEELKFINEGINDIAKLSVVPEDTNVKFGYSEYLYLNIEDAITVKITPVDEATFVGFTTHETNY